MKLASTGMLSIRLYFKRDIIYFPIFLEKRYVKGGFCLI